MRTCWMVDAITNWMGDDAWLWTLSCSVRKLNYLGDVHVITGTVAATDPVANTTTIELSGVNQRGETTCTARATVILPTPDGGHAVAPDFKAAEVPAATAPGAPGEGAS